MKLSLALNNPDLKRYTISFFGYETYTDYTVGTTREEIIKEAAEKMGINKYVKCENLQIFNLDDTDYYDEEVWAYDAIVTGQLDGGEVVTQEYGYLPYKPTIQDISEIATNVYGLMNCCYNIKVEDLKISKQKVGRWSRDRREKHCAHHIKNTTPYKNRRDYDIQATERSARSAEKYMQSIKGFFSWLFD